MSRIPLSNSLWNTVENFPALGRERGNNESLALRLSDRESGATQGALRACSACAGDYEDPDQTAGTPEPGENEGLLGEAGGHLEDAAQQENEFPARER
jgi:hypothetical protein